MASNRRSPGFRLPAWMRDLAAGIRDVAEEPARPALPWYVPDLRRSEVAADRLHIAQGVPEYDQLATHNVIYALERVGDETLWAVYRYERWSHNRAAVLKAVRRRLRSFAA